MENWYYLMQLSIILLTAVQVKSLNYGLMQPKFIPPVKKLNFNPINSFDEKTINSGVLFEQLYYIRVSENQFQSNYNIDISRFNSRISLLSEYKSKLEIYCLHLHQKYECNFLIDRIQNYIFHGESILHDITEINSPKLNHPINLEIIREERITSFLKDITVGNIMNQTYFLIHELIQDSNIILELLNKIDSSNIMKIFPLDALTQYFNHIKLNLKVDEELLLNIPMLEPQNIFLVSFFNISCTNKTMTLHITTPIMKKEKFTLFKSLPISTKSLGKSITLETYPYFLLNVKQTQIISFNDTSLCKIILNRNTRACLLANTRITKRNDSCELNLMNDKVENNEQDSCLIRSIPKMNFIIKITSQNTYYCIINYPTNINAICQNIPTKIKLNKNGILRLNKNCTITAKNTTVLTFYSASNIATLKFDLQNYYESKQEMVLQPINPIIIDNSNIPPSIKASTNLFTDITIALAGKIKKGETPISDLNKIMNKTGITGTYVTVSRAYLKFVFKMIEEFMGFDKKVSDFLSKIPKNILYFIISILITLSLTIILFYIIKACIQRHIVNKNIQNRIIISQEYRIPNENA